MVYNDRVTVIRKEVTKGYLGDDVIEEVKEVYPCAKSKLMDREQMGLFGSYNLSAFKLHIQGHHRDIKELEYEGVRRAVKGSILHRNSTVVIVE